MKAYVENNEVLLGDASIKNTAEKKGDECMNLYPNKIYD